MDRPVKVPLSGKNGQGRFFLVDPEDAHLFVGETFTLATGGYAFNSRLGLAHHLVAEKYIGPLPSDKSVDHRNRDKLDNRRVNLRHADAYEQAWNKDAPANNTSGFKGVTEKDASKVDDLYGQKLWSAHITAHGQRYELGDFHEKEHAAYAYNCAALVLHGDFSCLNKIPLREEPDPRYPADIDDRIEAQVERRLAYLGAVPVPSGAGDDDEIVSEDEGDQESEEEMDEDGDEDDPDLPQKSLEKVAKFRRVLAKHPGAWISWIDEGKVKTFGSPSGAGSAAITIPARLSGDRDTVIKPILVKIVSLLTRSSTLGAETRRILARHDIDYPLKIKRLKKSTNMKGALQDIRQLLQREKRCEVMPCGSLRTSADILGVLI